MADERHEELGDEPTAQDDAAAQAAADELTRARSTSPAYERRIQRMAARAPKR